MYWKSVLNTYLENKTWSKKTLVTEVQEKWHPSLHICVCVVRFVFWNEGTLASIWSEERRGFGTGGSERQRAELWSISPGLALHSGLSGDSWQLSARDNRGTPPLALHTLYTGSITFKTPAQGLPKKEKKNYMS